MKITHDSEARYIDFKEVKVGETFIHTQTPYMKIKCIKNFYTTQEYNTISLESGYLVCFHDSDRVHLINSELIIHD